MKLSSMVAAIAALSGLALGAAPASARVTGEAELAKELAGRVPGKPVDCLYMPSVTDSHVIDRTAIVYRSGSTLYVNRPRNGADSLRDDDVMVVKMNTSQLCSIDTVTMHDRTAHFMTGVVFLGEFVPYNKPRG